MPPDIIAELQKPLVNQTDANTFRIGIVLNGTVAAGAWTAGVLDALVEALDAWEQAKPGDPDVPQHRVRLDILAGASGGGVCAALLARASARQFPPVQDSNGNAANPFWDVWVEKLDIANMLDVDDLQNPAAPAASLLSGKAIQTAVDAILKWGIDLKPLAAPRPWLADPFHVAVTLTNLRGVPYAVACDSGEDGEPRASWYVAHADYALFAFPAAPGGAGIRADEWTVNREFTLAADAWAGFAAYARATGAFPLGFPPARLSRPTAHYEWRAVVLPGGLRNGKVEPDQPCLLQPAWDALPLADQPGDTYSFDCVDGGACNNQPVELVRVALAGLGGTLERHAKKATAAVLLIDPFASAPACPVPSAALDLFGVGLGLAQAWEGQARFATSDLLLAADSTVFSRFLLTAGRNNAAGSFVCGGDAVAGSGLGAFLGFLDRRYRVHDYLLGRKNCRDWLRSYFVLDQDNPVFGGFGATPAAADYRPAGTRTLPIIPLVPPLREQLDQPDWPVLQPATDGLQDAIERRLSAVAQRMAEQSGVPFSGVLASVLAGWGSAYASKTIAAAAARQNARA